jgi:outer membrane immunogenic protein
LKGDDQATTAFGSTQTSGNLTTSLSDTAINTLHSKTSGIASLTAKLGFASDAWDHTLFYIKGGAAYSRNSYTVSETQNISSCTTFGTAETLCSAGTASNQLSWSKNRWGWLAGIGLEYALNDNLSAMAEYNYLGFGNDNFAVSGQQCDSTGVCYLISRGFDVNENVHVVKFGINWHWR